MPLFRRPSARFLLLASLLVVPAVLMAKGCSTSYANRDPSGQAFPVVVGQSLEKERTELPTAVAGGPAILLIGYEQATQFDIDRWLMGLLQAEVDAAIVEVPTIPGLVPTLASGWIDEGMRSGIPREDWGSVVTLYGDAATPVAELTGNENGRNARVIVLDAAGRIAWFDDTGYAPRKAMAIAALVPTLRSIGRDSPMPSRAIPAYDAVALSPEQAREDLELLRAALEGVHPGLYRYGDKKTVDDRFASLHEAFADGGTDLDLYRDVSLAIGAIRCGHSRVEAPRAFDAYRAQVPTHLPFRFRLLEGRMIVTTADPRAGSLPRGTEIVSINGVPTPELVERIGPTVPLDGRTDHIRPSRLDTAYEFSDSGLDHYLPLFYGVRDDFTLECRSLDGETFGVKVGAITRPEWIGLEPAGPDNFADSVTLERIDAHTSLLRVDSFINYRNTVEPDKVYRPIFRSLNDEQVEHLIIDLRSNGGGSSDAAWALARFLIDTPVRFKPPRVRNYRYDDELTTHMSTWVEGAFDMPDEAFRKRDDGWYELLPSASGRADELAPDPDRYAGRVTVLVGPYNASGTTMLVATLKEAGRVRLVGQPTGGSAEGPTAGVLFTLRLPNSGIAVNIPVLFERSPVESFEPGLGARPDETVPVTIDDFLAGRDRTLDAAIRRSN